METQSRGLRGGTLQREMSLYPKEEGAEHYLARKRSRDPKEETAGESWRGPGTRKKAVKWGSAGGGGKFVSRGTSRSRKGRKCRGVQLPTRESSQPRVRGHLLKIEPFGTSA